MSVNVNTELTVPEANALAQFLKRIGFSEFRALATSDDEAYDMQSGATKVAKALAEIGYNPR